MKTLDCTIRDGGYINRWHFTDELVKECYDTLSDSGIDYVELGYNNNFEIYNNDLCGNWRYVTEERLRDVIVNKKAKIAIMADFGKTDLDNFLPKEKSMVDLIRVAFHKKDIEKALEYCNELKIKGYEVSANAMATVHYTDSDLKLLCNLVYKYKIDYLYIADSYGSLTPSSLSIIHNNIISLFNEIDKEYRYKLGYHAHNNMQNALANAIYAANNGFDIVDSTIYGMGRGAGNLCTEIFLSYLITSDIMFSNTYDNDEKEYKLLPLLKCAEKHIVPINQSDATWGYSLLWLISAHFSCHPNYVSKLKDYKIQDVDSVWKIIKELTDRGDQKMFSVDKINNVIKDIN